MTGQYRPGGQSAIIDEPEDRDVFRGAPPAPVRDAIDGIGELRERACDLPLGPMFAPARELLC